MRQITIAIDPRHSAAMGLPPSCAQDRIRDIEQRAAMRILARAGRHDVVLRMVRQDETAMRLRLIERQNEAFWRATA